MPGMREKTLSESLVQEGQLFGPSGTTNQLNKRFEALFRFITTCSKYHGVKGHRLWQSWQVMGKVSVSCLLTRL